MDNSMLKAESQHNINMLMTERLIRLTKKVNAHTMILHTHETLLRELGIDKVY